MTLIFGFQAVLLKTVASDKEKKNGAWGAEGRFSGKPWHHCQGQTTCYLKGRVT